MSPLPSAPVHPLSFILHPYPSAPVHHSSFLIHPFRPSLLHPSSFILHPYSTRPSFTLIELLAVLLLLGLLAGAVSFSLASTNRSASLADVVGQVTQYDALSRAHARRTGRPSTVVFSLRDSTISRPAGATLTFPKGYTLREVRFPARRVSFAQATLPISPLGHATPYALHIAGPDDRRQWLFFTGLTGQCLELNNRELDQLFQSLSQGPDAH